MFIKDLFTTLCMFTRQTERAANRLGVRYFLPQLFRLRYANMGGLDPEVFTRQLDSLRSFKESTWCNYWTAIAQEYEMEAEKILGQNGENQTEEVRDLLVKAVTYYTVGAFPGNSPLRMDAYYKAKALFGRAVPMVDDRIKKVTLSIGGEEVEGYERFPAGRKKGPMVIITNGLEGTLQEIALPLIKYQDANMGLFIMEMPGTYAYQHPMSGASEEIYNGVIEHYASHYRVDAKRIAMVGVSFGGYWSARMATASSQLKCAVVCGAPLHYAFSPASALGTPEIIVSVLMKVCGADNPMTLGQKLRELSFEANDLYRRIDIPLLIINGDNDTLMGTRDSIVLDAKVPKAFLKLYENDDHCAMNHYQEWLDLTFEWLGMQLGA